MEAGKEATDLRAPHDYRESMVSLSDQTLIPTSVSPHNRLGSRPAKTCEEQCVGDKLDINAARSMIPSSSPGKGPFVGHDRKPSHISAYSSSVYSEKSSATTSTKTKNCEKSPTCETEAKFADPQNTSANDKALKCALLVDVGELKAQVALLSPLPLQPSQTASISLRRDSIPHQSKTLLQGGSSGRSMQSSRSSRYASSGEDSALKENVYETSSETASSRSSEKSQELNKVAPNAVNEKAARLLGLGQQSPTSPPPVTPTTSQSATTRRNSNERSWSSPRVIKNMVSRMALTGQKTSPPLGDSPSSVRAHRPSDHDIQSPSRCGETLSIRKRRFGIDRITKGETMSTELCGIAEETFTSPADTIMTRISSARKAVSIPNRRGYRPLSVKIGEAFNPFSARENRIDSVELPQGMAESLRANSQEPRKGIELSQKVNWSENLDPHIFNANFVATLTSKTPPDIEDHPAFRVDPFSVQDPEPLLQYSISSKGAWVPRRSDSEWWIESQASSNNSDDVESVIIALESVDHNVAARYGRGSSLSFQGDGTPASDVERPGGTRKSHVNQNIEKRSRRGLPPSPSFYRFNSWTSSGKAPSMTELPFASGSFIDDNDMEGKRTRGLYNFFKSIGGGKASGKANVMLTDEGGLRKTSAERDRVEQIQRLRTRLNARSYDHNLADIQPRHPTTGRGWHSRNLKCTSCSDLVCPSCGRACCSFKACGLIAENLLTPTDIRDAAFSDIIAISQCFPVGRESPTFIQCTHETGCGKFVCPDCCGMCPDDCCQDVQCRKCKPHPWARCDWHPDSDAKLKDAAQHRANQGRIEHEEKILQVE